MNLIPLEQEVVANQFAAGAEGMLVAPFLSIVVFVIFIFFAYVKAFAAGLLICELKVYRDRNGETPEYEKWLDAAVGELKSGTLMLLFLFAILVISHHLNPMLFQ